MRLTQAQIAKIQGRWLGRPEFLGFPDAERDAADTNRWLKDLAVRPTWFSTAMEDNATLVVGRKGVGKSASRIAAAAAAKEGRHDRIVVEVSADELASRHAERLQKAIQRGYGAVADWCYVFGELIVRNVAMSLAGTLIVDDDADAVRAWSVLEGVSERDFGERVASAMASLVPWARKLKDERGTTGISDERIQRVAKATDFALYIDDFDNLQEDRSLANIRLIRDAVEAADRVTHQNQKASVHLLMRQDLWLRLRPGWHYADKIAGLVQLNWSQEDLRKWAERRIRYGAALALGTEPQALKTDFGELWSVFFPDEIVLRNEKESSGLHYMVRRTMYTPRGLRQFMQLVLERLKRLPADLRNVEDAEQVFSTDQLEFLKTEFGGLCEGLDICLQSFTAKRMDFVPTDLYKHLNGLIGNGQVRLLPGASDGDDAIALARFLFRIGFLEVRYPQEGRFEVRDAMRYPDHWKSIRKDDAVTWAVRSAFFLALRAH